MVVVKKLIALALLAAFVISAGVGCSGGTTTGGSGPRPTGSSTPK
jgi:hypothetical protein